MKKQITNSDSVPNAESVQKKHDLPVFVPPVIFILTTLFFFWEVIVGNSFFWEDIVRFVYPLQDFAASASAKGDIPFWNPFTFSGMPFLGDLQVGFFYPLNRLLHCFTTSDGNLSFHALQMMIIFHFFLAQISFFFLARSLKISNAGGMIGAIAYSFSLIMVCHSIHPMIVAHLAWFPLIVMLFINGIKEKDISSGIGAGLIYGVSMLSGHTQMSLYEGLILFFIFAWLLITDIKDGKAKGVQILLPMVSAALTVIIAAGMFMMQYLPTNELVKHSKRSDSSYEFVTQGSLEFNQVFTGMVPRLFGSVNGEDNVRVPYYKTQMQHNYWETSFYFGISTLALGLFGFIACFKRREVQLMLGLAVFAFLFAMGSNGFIFDIFFNLPFFGMFRNPARMMFACVFAFSISAGFGFDALYDAVTERKKLMKYVYIAFGIVTLLAVFGAFGMFAGLADTPEEYVSDVNQYGMLAAVFAILTMTLCTTASRFRYNAAFAGIAMALIAFFDLYFAGADFNQSSNDPQDQFILQPELKKLLTPHFPNDVFRAKTRLYDANGRTMGKALEDNSGMIDEIMLVEGYNPLMLERMIPPIAPESKINDMRNVRYSLEIDTMARSLAFMKRETAFGNAWFVYNYKVVPTDELANAAKNKNYSLLKDVDFANCVVLEKNPKTTYSGKISDSVNHSVKVLKYANNEIKYKVNSAENAVLCFSEMYYPEWKAYIDGKETEIFAANYSFRAIELPAGDHTVEMHFECPAYEKGRTISIATVSVSIIAIFVLIFLGKKKKNI